MIMYAFQFDTAIHPQDLIRRIHVLVGSIPTEIGRLTNLVSVNLEQNKLSGKLVKR